MVINNSQTLQRQTTFQIIEPLFYDEFNTQDPVFPEWTLERMPRNINTRRIHLDKYKMSHGWHYESYNTKGKFRCTRCIRTGAEEHIASWSSSYTTVLFRVYYGPDTDEFGQTWIGGWIQMKIFAQQCMRCNIYITGELDNERPRLLVKWLYKWIPNKFYGYRFKHSPYRGKATHQHHLDNHCEACAAGWCHYLQVRQQHD